MTGIIEMMVPKQLLFSVCAMYYIFSVSTKFPAATQFLVPTSSLVANFVGAATRINLNFVQTESTIARASVFGTHHPKRIPFDALDQPLYTSRETSKLQLLLY